MIKLPVLIAEHSSLSNPKSSLRFGRDSLWRGKKLSISKLQMLDNGKLKELFLNIVKILFTEWWLPFLQYVNSFYSKMRLPQATCHVGTVGGVCLGDLGGSVLKEILQELNGLWKDERMQNYSFCHKWCFCWFWV